MKNGFTLSEVLISLAVMAVIVGATSLVSIRGYTQKNNDAKRKADLELVRSALENYKSNELSRDYPATNYSGLDTALESYLPTMPSAPGSTPYLYSRITAYTYQLCATMETPANQNSVCTIGGNYGVTQP